PGSVVRGFSFLRGRQHIQPCRPRHRASRGMMLTTDPRRIWSDCYGFTRSATVQSLVANGIAAARLKSFGNGPFAPVASNATEDGRAKNRRVELVRQ
ncbi:MAG: hypothetical protein ACXWWJ_00235, partial [Nitrospira sp.]